MPGSEEGSGTAPPLEEASPLEHGRSPRAALDLALERKDPQERHERRLERERKRGAPSANLARARRSDCRAMYTRPWTAREGGKLKTVKNPLDRFFEKLGAAQGSVYYTPANASHYAQKLSERRF